MTATTRLDRTARTTGRGRVAELAPADGRPGSMSDGLGHGQPPGGSGRAAAGRSPACGRPAAPGRSRTRSSSSSLVKHATLMRTRVDERHRPGDGEDPRPELVDDGLGRPAVDPERDEAGHRVARGQHGHTGDGRQPVVGPARPSPRPRRYTQSSPMNMLSQPIERAMPTTDGRWKDEPSNRRALAQVVPSPAESNASKVKCPAKVGRRRSRACAGDGDGAHALRARAATSGPGWRRRRRRSRPDRPGWPRRSARHRRRRRPRERGPWPRSRRWA